MQAHNAMRALIKVRFVDYASLQVFILVLSRLWSLNNLHHLGLQADDRKEGKSACEDNRQSWKLIAQIGYSVSLWLLAW